MKSTSVRRLCVSMTAMIVLARVVLGQTPGTGAITGIVLDPTNRAVVNAQVLVVEDATHISRTVTTTSEGVFRVRARVDDTNNVEGQFSARTCE